MKRYLLTLAVLATALTAGARTARPSRAELQQQAVEAMAEADSLRRLSDTQSVLIDSLQQLLDRSETLLAARNAANRTPEAELTPEQRAEDSVATLRLRLERKQIESTFDTNGLTVIDTLNSGNDALYVILYGNNTWKYVRNRAVAKDSTIFEKYWDTESLFPYQSVNIAAMPQSVVIDLIDSTRSYHCPYQGAVNPRGKYGPRRGRRHQGVDLPLKMGDPVYATFCGRVRISKYVRGYGNLVIIRHDNGLETYYGHLSERLAEPGQWVEAGEVIGLGGSTGRSTGPPPLRDPLLRTGIRSRAADRLQERHALPRDLPAEKVLLQHLLQCRAGFRGRDRQRGTGQEGGSRKGSHALPPHPLGRHAGCSGPPLRYHGFEHLPPERHQVDDDPAHRPHAARKIIGENNLSRA